MREQLSAALSRAFDDTGVRVLILASDGAVFSAGTDLQEVGGDDFLPQKLLEEEYKPILMAIATGAKPVVCALQGVAAGVGASLAMACDLIVMAEDACIYQAFSHIGLIPDGGATWQLVHAMGSKRAFEVIVNGERIAAQECPATGLVNKVVAAEVLTAETRAVAEGLTHKAPLAMRYAKQALHRVRQMDLSDAISFEAALQNYCTRSDDAKEGSKAFFEKRSPVFKGR